MGHNQDASNVPLERDSNRFRLLFTNSAPEMPAGYEIKVDPTTTRELVGKRVRALKAATNGRASG